MPILAKETSIFPETLFDELLDQPSERLWWGIYTKARQEKALSRDLFARQIPFYLPLVKKTQRPRGRTTTSYIPLFAGYLFLFGTEEERIQSFKTNRISRVLDIEDAEQLVHDLSQFRQLIATDAPLTVESRLVPGNRVRVLKGLFAGLEGMVMKRRGQTRLLVCVNFLQQGASVEIEDYLLEPID